MDEVTSPTTTTTTTAAARPRRRRGQAHGCLRQGDGLVALPFLIPFFAVYAIFLIYPLARVVHMSFFSWDLLGNHQYIGLDNYTHLFTIDRFWPDMAHTFYFTALTVPALVALGLGLAVGLNASFRGRTLLRTIFFAPFVLPISVVTLLWIWLLQPQFGLVNEVLTLAHLPTVAWLSSPTAAMPAIAVASVWWSVGFNLVLFLAGLQGISREYYEAATIDGANRWHLFRYVTLPLLRHTTELVALLQVVASLQIFGQVYLMTNGGPNGATEVALEYMYDRAFSAYHLGYASAIAVMLFAVIFVFSLVQARLSFARASNQ